MKRKTFQILSPATFDTLHGTETYVQYGYVVQAQSEADEVCFECSFA